MVFGEKMKGNLEKGFRGLLFYIIKAVAKHDLMCAGIILSKAGNGDIIGITEIDLFFIGVPNHNGDRISRTV